MYILLNNGYEPLTKFLLNIKDIFDKKNINCKIVKIKNLKVCKDDVLFLFSPYLTIGLMSLNCKFVIINTEQLRVKKWGDKIIPLLDNDNILCIWDYSYSNINFIKNIYSNKKCQFIPPGYHYSYEYPINEYPINEYNYDIIFYGGMNPRRKRIKRLLEDKYKVLFFYDFNKTDYYIKKAKIVLIINFYEENSTIDYYRCNKLFANKKFIIHELPNIDEQNKDEFKMLNNSVIFCKYNDIIKNCDKYLALSQKERDIYCEKTYNTFKNNMSLEKYILSCESL
jgi:hypothetical protein